MKDKKSKVAKVIISFKEDIESIIVPDKDLWNILPNDTCIRINHYPTKYDDMTIIPLDRIYSIVYTNQY